MLEAAARVNRLSWEKPISELIGLGTLMRGAEEGRAFEVYRGWASNKRSARIVSQDLLEFVSP
jgi:hypothetical protein